MTSTELISNKDNQTNRVSHKVNLSTAFWSNFKMNLKSLKKVLIVMCVLHLLGLPLLIVAGISSEISDSSAMRGFAILAMFCTAVALLTGFIIALNSFDYLFKKSKVDMVYALPLTTNQRFLSDYLSGLCGYTIPYLVSVVIALTIHGLACLGIDRWADTAVDENITQYMLKLAFGGLLIMLMFYTLTVLITSCCGSMFEAIAYNILANGLIPGVIALFFYVFFDDLYGINVSEYLLSYISNSSPIGGIVGLVENLESDFTQLLKWYLLTLIADVVYFFVAYFLYSKRKAEDVSKPFVFKAFYYVVMTAITFVIISIMVEIDQSDAIAPMLFLSAIVYFICEVIANRGFKKFGWSVLRYVGTVCGVVALCLVLNGTNGFGIEDRVPTASSIKSVSINYTGVYSTDANYYYYYGSSSSQTTFTDRDAIQKVVDFHKDAVKNHFKGYIDYDYYDYAEYSSYDADVNDYDSKSEYYQYVNITYNTKLGGKVSRSYRVSFEQYMMLKELSLDSNYIEDYSTKFNSTLLEYYNNGYDYYYTTDSIPVEERDYYLDVYSKVQINPKTYDNVTYSQIVELSNCYKQDLEARTMDDILTPDTYCYIDGYVIFSTYENTIKFLTKNGFLPPTLETELQSYNLYNEYSYDCILYSPDDITCVGGDYYTSVSAYKANGGSYVYSTGTILQLLEVAQPNYITTDRCYILSFQGDMYVIPKAYTELADDVYQNTTYYSMDDVTYAMVSVDELLEGHDYLSCYLALHDVWKEHFTETYTNYEDFVEELLYGTVDFYTNSTEYTGDIASEDFNTLADYSGYFWTVYSDSNLESLYWDYDFDSNYPEYEDFIWYVLKFDFSVYPEDELFTDDTSEVQSNATDETTTQEEESPNIADKPIDESLGNI